MKKTIKSALAIVLSLAITFSIIGVGVVAITGPLTSNSSVTVAEGSNIINADTVDEAIDLMQTYPEMFGDYDAAGTTTTTKDSVVYPTVIIPGISQSISYLADENGQPVVNSNGTELSGGLLIIDDSKLVPTLVNNLLAPLLDSLIYQRTNNDNLANGVYNTVTELFAIQSSDPSGKPTHNLKTVKYDQPVGRMSEDDRDYFYRMIPMNTLTEDTVDATTGTVIQEAILDENELFLYAFPLIGDPFESAQGLHEYIQFIKEYTGKDKVNIVTISLGGTILTAYLELMKETDPNYTDVNRIVNVVSCLNGTDVMGDFYLRNFKINGEYDEYFFHEYVPMIMKESNGYGTLGYIINIAIKILPEDVIKTVLTAAVDGIIDTLMHNCPQFWAMIPSDRFEDAKAKYHEIWEDEQYAELAPKLDAFQRARVNLVDNLKAFNSVNDRKVHNVAGYDLDYSAQDYCFFDAMKSSDTTNSDAIIDIDSTTLGAQYATAGQVLEDDILFAKDSRVSPDGSINIAKCAFPDNVWLFHGQHHEVGRNDVVISLIGRLITGEIKSVNDMSVEYPQFNGNRNTKNIRRWLLEEAEEVFADYAENPSAYNSADIAELEDAYREAHALLLNTICEPTSADAVTERLLNALRRVGKEGEAADESTNQILEMICKFLDDVIYEVFGPHGFSDIKDKGPFNG